MPENYDDLEHLPNYEEEIEEKFRKSVTDDINNDKAIKDSEKQ
ncbi:TPA: hypothetical protein ACPTMM_000095 [Escherichia coli]